MSRFYEYASPLLFRLDAEKAHTLTLALLRRGLAPRVPAVDDPALRVTLWDRQFPNPVGLAAGFDKNAEAPGALLGLGFGFVEAGTVTPWPQPGNPRPRIFRAPAQHAVINRMGFPGEGLEKFRANLQKFLERRPRPPGLVGLNIGMNKDQTDPAKDYTLLVRALAPLADYLAVNISSPNTPGLRDLQQPDALRALLDRLMEERARTCPTFPPPLLLKLSPDLEDGRMEAVARTVLDAGVDGLILTNTTLARPAGLPPDFAAQQGGLSGAPLKDRATATLARFYALTDGKIPLIGAGGVASGVDAYEKIRAGASLVQVYTGLVYRGPDLARTINRALSALLKRDGFTHISEAVGTDARTRAAA